MVKPLSAISILLFLLIIPSATAISMGTVIKQDTLTINNGDSGTFTILFWNPENITYNVSLNIENAPTNWYVAIEPKLFSLDSNTGTELIQIPSMSNPIKALPVDVIVKPSTESPGSYKIEVSATSIPVKQGISLSQRRVMYLNVVIPGVQNEQQLQNIISNNIKQFGNVVQNAVIGIPGMVFYVVALIGILVVSYLIYKYA